MSDIDEDDWRRIYEAFREAYPNRYADRSMIVDEMISAYIRELHEWRDDGK